ncbi:hypothetical protein [Phocaeicola coprocola]|uniref:hypothetical protein n=1 Tax=Phocaeicola coprocola TaxID=310298 RepID=UPI0026734044|nr:hypothetical protein [Phocaeicola coprocola]
MEKYFFEKKIFERSYTFTQIDSDQSIDTKYIINNKINGFIITTKDVEKKIKGIRKITTYQFLKALNLNTLLYENISELQNLNNLEYISFYGKVDYKIPFSSLKKLWCIYLNYDKKTCKSIFECISLENLFLDHYLCKSSFEFEHLTKLKRIGLTKTNLMEFYAINNMPYLEHIGIGYNPNLTSLEWLDGNESLTSISLKNCKNINNWEIIGSMNNIKQITIDSCGILPSLNFLKKLTNLQEIRILGSTYIKDNKIKEILEMPQLKYIFIPVKKEYDITLQDLNEFNLKNEY